ncbi:hypothetical protein EMPG_15897 [Blastomyces silverae]|uniref:Uncharacterized protein n=1 Tax=Blastomyces silverae TaxID=2060906 RepID=A0A0H1BC41_9EURO|nr:hypothetical protein EMPG_15897 [Blastomyces silverae]
MWSERIWLYGGLAVFGGFTLYDIQKILHHARMAERGLIKKDVVNESISLELDFLNIFIRMVQILGMRGNNRKYGVRGLEFLSHAERKYFKLAI